MKLSAPKETTWWIAVVVGALGLLSELGILSISLGISNFWLVTIGFILLILGTALKGF